MVSQHGELAATPRFRLGNEHEPIAFIECALFICVSGVRIPHIDIRTIIASIYPSVVLVLVEQQTPQTQARYFDTTAPWVYLECDFCQPSLPHQFCSVTDHDPIGVLERYPARHIQRNEEAGGRINSSWIARGKMNILCALQQIIRIGDLCRSGRVDLNG